MTDHDDTAEVAAADVFLEPVWNFRVGPRDALLILKALGGRLGEEDDEPALALCDRLTALRQRHGDEMARALDRANEGMEAAREARGLDPNPLPGRRRNKGAK